jgi:hypothetical protein
MVHSVKNRKVSFADSPLQFRRRGDNKERERGREREAKT